MYTVICIPARLNSSRLPGKLLMPINGLSVIRLTLNKAIKSNADRVMVITDSEDIYDECHPHAVFHPHPAYSGTHRISNYWKEIYQYYQRVDLVVNLQADEPLFELDNLNRFVAFALEHPKHLCTAVKKSDDGVQAIIEDGWAVGFSRNKVSGWGHIGIYSYPIEFLLGFQQKEALDLEQTGFLPLNVIELESEAFGIDTLENLRKAQNVISIDK